MLFRSDGREALQFVVLGVLSEFAVDLGSMFKQATDKAFAKSARCRAKSTEGVKILEVGNPCAAPLIALVEELDGGLTAFATYSHNDSGERWCDARRGAEGLNGSARGFGAAVALVAKAPLSGLAFVPKKKNRVNDRDAGIDRHPAKLITHGSRDQAGMGGLPLENDSEANNGIGFVFSDKLSCQIGDLKGARCMNHVGLGERLNQGDFLQRLGQHRLHKFSIVPACHNRKVICGLGIKGGSG